LYVRNGTYYARLYLRGGTKWVSLKTKTKAVAKTSLAKLLQQHHGARDAERAVQQGAATVRELASVYLRSQDIRTDIKGASKIHRRATVENLFRTWPELEGRLPSKVSGIECQEWAHRHHENHSAPFHNATVDSLRGILEVAVGRGLIARNPAEAVSKVRVPQKKLELPTSEQFKQIVALVRSSRTGTAKGNGDLIEFLAYGGCRISEAIRVRWRDVDFENGRIYLEPGKNSASRHVPLLPAMRDLLEHIKSKPRYASSRKRDPFVLSVTSCEKSLSRACEKSKCHRLVHHDLRHLFATRCIQSGVPIPTVAHWLGHKDGGALAMKVYGHLTDEHSQTAAAKVIF
jgi:integrase